MLEYRCIEMVEELIYGHLRTEQLVTHWEGDYGRRNRPIRASPLTYQVNGTQYISVVATNTVLTFGLP